MVNYIYEKYSDFKNYYYPQFLKPVIEGDQVLYSEFAYSTKMQLLLMIFAYTYNFILMYLIANIIMRLYGETASVRRKALFAFLTGSVMYTGFTYLVYYLGDMQQFSQAKYLIVVSPNPFMALIYCFLGIKILKLSNVRSIKLMGDVYLYNAIINSITRLLGSIFFVQNTERFNYLLDCSMLAASLVIFILIYKATCLILIHNPAWFINKSQQLVNIKKDLLIFILKAGLIYVCIVSFPLLITSTVVANTLIFLFLSMLFACTLTYGKYEQTKADVHNKELHINSLIKASDEFRAVKHDFYNILQTYSGYFELGNYAGCKKYHDSLVKLTLQAGQSLELNYRLQENPSLVSLLLNKREKASQLNMQLEVSLNCPLANLPIAEVDICRVLACLLDNAIEAANESEQRRVSFIMEPKTIKTRLIIITNSTKPPLEKAAMFTPGTSSKQGHQGIGLNTVQKIINNYGNCSFQMHYLNNEMMVYLELKQL